MVMRAYPKTVLRTIKNNPGRFVSITLIILLGIAFISGLGTLSYKMRHALAYGYETACAPDVIVVGKTEEGVSGQAIERFSGSSEVAQAQNYTVIETGSTRIYVTSLGDQRVGKLVLREGRFPQNADEVVAERESDAVKPRNLGEVVTALGGEKTVVGIVENAMLHYRGGEAARTGDGTIDSVYYLDDAYYPSVFPVTDVYLRMNLNGRGEYFSEKYDDAAAAAAEALRGESDGSEEYLTLRETQDYALAQSYEKKINVIVAIFPVFFIAVAALVVLATMTRMIEEERSMIGCYRTLGYGDGKIVFKYLFFSLVCCLLGGSGGFAIGFTLLPRAVLPAFRSMFFLPDWNRWLNPLMGVIAALGMLIAVCAVTFYLIRRELRVPPAAILRPKTPKAGKKIFLEHIPVLWKRLSFRYKSTMRNIFRYGKHLLMTVVSVSGSTALVLAGMGLSDVSRSDHIRESFSNMADSMSMISFVIIAFAALLSALVVYNLTNMNIEERKRELATLKVLGYHQAEVCGYVFREVFIMALMGIAIGLPLGYGLCRFAFSYLEFGSVSDVRWYSYVVTALFVAALVGIVDLILQFKIKKVDMTSSLKTVE
ncbi:MAG: ABC transporter permease [Candidatus Gallimonas sp.]